MIFAGDKSRGPGAESQFISFFTPDGIAAAI